MNAQLRVVAPHHPTRYYFARLARSIWHSKLKDDGDATDPAHLKACALFRKVADCAWEFQTSEKNLPVLELPRTPVFSGGLPWVTNDWVSQVVLAGTAYRIVIMGCTAMRQPHSRTGADRDGPTRRSLS